MKNKFEASSLIKFFFTYTKTQFGHHIKTICTNNGLEFSLKQFYDEHGVIHQTSCAETPQQNSIVEQKL